MKYRGVEQLEARRAHNPEVVGSSPASATKSVTVVGAISTTVIFIFHRPREDFAKSGAFPEHFRPSARCAPEFAAAMMRKTRA